MAFRDGPFENLKVPLVVTAVGAVVLGIVAAVLLLLSDRRDGSSPYGAVRNGGDAAAGPVGGILAAPVRFIGSVSDGIAGYFFAVEENRRLKAEIKELQPWRDQAIALKNVNARYEAMLGIRTEPAVPLARARSISDARGPFARARLIDAGSAAGIAVGHPVINEHGLVGRVIGTSGNVSRVLLVTDVASRIPVLVDRTDARAMLTGDGSGNPRLEFVRGVGSVQSGDRILTSGDGGGLPRGLPVGVVARGIDGSWRVKLFSDRAAIDYVSVMKFQDFSLLVSPEALSAPPLAGLPDEAPPPARPAAPAPVATAPASRTPASPTPAAPTPAAGATR